ncbi:MAG: hypothetical protein SGJ13_14660 [Actinomycetota bacterium]|nr:hypothetical protein [Actinomycetota bacterium]
MQDLAPDLADSIMQSCAGLGGVAEPEQLRPSAWDLAYEGGVVVELDEELHFNRYRLVTFEAPWTASLPWRISYRQYCDAHEAECLTAGGWGQRWTNPSCEAMFGAADNPGVFGAVGAPRWKQRALYDSIKDAYARSTGVRLARISVHDHVGGVEIGRGLQGAETLNVDALRAFVEQRTTRPT